MSGGTEAVDMFTYCSQSLRQPRCLGRPGRHHRHRWPRFSSAWSIAWVCGRSAGARDNAAGCTSAASPASSAWTPPPSSPAASLQPGQMIALDTATGERLDNHQIMAPHRRRGRKTELRRRSIHELNRSADHHPRRFDFTPQTRRSRSAPMLADATGRSIICSRPTAGTSSGPAS